MKKINLFALAVLVPFFYLSRAAIAQSAAVSNITNELKDSYGKINGVIGTPVSGPSSSDSAGIATLNQALDAVQNVFKDPGNNKFTIANGNGELEAAVTQIQNHLQLPGATSDALSTDLNQIGNVLSSISTQISDINNKMSQWDPVINGKVKEITDIGANTDTHFVGVGKNKDAIFADIDTANAQLSGSNPPLTAGQKETITPLIASVKRMGEKITLNKDSLSRCRSKHGAALDTINSAFQAIDDVVVSAINPLLSRAQGVNDLEKSLPKVAGHAGQCSSLATTPDWCSYLNTYVSKLTNFNNSSENNLKASEADLEKIKSGLDNAQAILSDSSCPKS